MSGRRPSRATLTVVAALATGCVRAPTPLSPDVRGSIGLPHRGTLTDGASLPQTGAGFAR
jgi:penicillin-insensitive murein endopeptidase